MGRHTLTSKCHKYGEQDIWWYAIPPLGNKYRAGDTVEFVMRDYVAGKAGVFDLQLDGIWLQRIKSAPKDSRGYVHVHIWRYRDSSNCYISFGDKYHGEYSIDIALTRC